MENAMPAADRPAADSSSAAHDPLPPGIRADRRGGTDRRDEQDAQDGANSFARRRGPGRRLSDFVKAAEEGEMTKEQFLFLVAIDSFKKANNVAYPSWSDVLEVVRLLGYRKSMPAEIEFRNAEDWREQPDSPSGVRPQRWQERFLKDEPESPDSRAQQAA
ncbi:MAG: hypothetical protein Q9O74_03650 [Planctomycetota bacterium]|nr:hypothetical protein [Planctomycetota bacterium]